MRDWFNRVFIFIGTTTLTDEEWASVNVVDVVTDQYDQAAYDQMAAVLLAREAVSTMQSRLVGVFTAKGATLTEIPQAKTNIYIGNVL